MTDTTLTLHRILRVPRSLVWDCWTDPEHLRHWFVPRPHTIEKIEMDVMPGGRFNTLMKVDGNLYPNDGSILAVAPGERLVFTDMFLAGWQPVAEPGLGFSAELILKDHPEGTEYWAIARHRTPASAEAHEAMGFHDGWGTVATQLEEYIQGDLLAGDRTLVLTRHLAAPVARVWDAWTDPQILPRWFGPEGWTCTTHHIDLREGGEWRFTMAGHGMSYPNRHRYTRWLPGHRIEFLMDGMEGDADAKRVVVTLLPEGEGTRITQVMTFATPESLQEARGYRAEELGMQTLAKLAAVVEKG